MQLHKVPTCLMKFITSCHLQVWWPEDRSCHALLSQVGFTTSSIGWRTHPSWLQGPCGEGEWLVLNEDGSRVICAERLCPCDPAEPELCEVKISGFKSRPMKSPGGGGRQPLGSKVGSMQGRNCCRTGGHLSTWGTTFGDFFLILFR